MEEDLAEQIKQLFEDNDIETIKYILGGQSQKSLDIVCSKLPTDMAAALRKLYEQLPKDSPSSLPQEQQQEGQRNRRIDDFLQQVNQQQRNECFLQFMSRVNQKLIYEQHFGFPFYDLVKRILLTHGDPKPQPTTVKAVHSQVQILYSVLFSQEILKHLEEDTHSMNTGLRDYLCMVFPTLTEKYYKFHHLYRNIKKETVQRPQDTSDAQEQNPTLSRETSPHEDATLQIDEKSFLVNLSDNAEDFESFQKNRSYNFLCFGLRKYQAYIALGPTIFSQIKQRQFCQLLSFLSIRFIRRMIFTIVRQRHQGKLLPLTEPITAQEIRRIGNNIVDEIAIQAKAFSPPQLQNIQEKAKAIFLQEFQKYSYANFVPRSTIKAIRDPGESLPQYVWRNCKQYKHIWSERVKIDHFLKHGGTRPKSQFLQEVQKQRKSYEENPGEIWKEYLRKKFGFKTSVETRGSKRTKLQSCTD